jgi:glucosamine--fructose-6-phosphate aminotransferase (isomerizing)
MSAAQFRHGPVEVASKDLRAVVFGTQSKTRQFDHSLAVDLSRVGAEVRWIGPKLSDSPVEILSAWPEELPDWCGPILEIIPIQTLAYRTAETKKIRPGEFRFATPITLSEGGFSPGATS